MSGTKRVLTTANHLGSIGGTETAQLAIFRALAERGWQVHVLYVSAGNLWEEWRRFASTRPIRATLPSRTAPISSTAGTLGALVSGVRAHPSVIYVHNAGDVPCALGMSIGARAPVVAHLHLPPPSRQPEWLNVALRRSTAVIAPSSDTAERWERVARVEKAKLSVIPVGIDVDTFRPISELERREVRAGIGVDPGDRLVLYAGRLERIKGGHFLIDAAKRATTPVHVVFCGAPGDDDYMVELHEAAEGGRVTFLGHRADMPKLMGAADLVVSPSNWLETQGLVIGESMACGTPVVASAVGAFPATMRGFPRQLVPPADPPALASAIDTYSGWRTTDPGLGERSRTWVLEHLSFDESIDEIDEVLTRAVS